MADIPELSYGTVRGRFLAGLLDSSDPNFDPDAEPLTGHVIFNATAEAVKVVGATPDPLTVFPRDLLVALDSEGYLSHNGSRDIALWATNDPDGTPVGWQWKVSFFLQYNNKGVSYRSFNFDLPAGETVDLTVVAPVVQPSEGVYITKGAKGDKGDPGLDGVDGGEMTVPELTAIAEATATSVSTDVATTTGAEAGEQAAIGVLAAEPGVAAAAAAAASSAVDAEVAERALVATDDPRIPALGREDSLRVLDTDNRIAFRVDSFGVTHAYDLESNVRKLGEVVEEAGDGDTFRIRGLDGFTAFAVRPNGRTYIADPEFGPSYQPDTGGGSAATPITKVVLVVQIGQSNGEGRGRPYSSRLDPQHPRLLMEQWTGTNVVGLVKATVPLDSQQQQTGLSVATIIGREHLMRSGDDTVVVILNAAAGGSGLLATPSQGTWQINYTGSNPRLYSIARAAIQQTLVHITSAYPGAAIETWFYWHQGESDAATSEAGYAAALDELFAAFRAEFGGSTIPFTCGGLVPEYMSVGTQGIRRALLGAQSRQEYTAYTDGIWNGGGSSDENDLVHYFREAVERLGKNMFTASMRAATAAATQVPHKPLDVSATFIQGTLRVRWSEPGTRYTNFVVQYRIDGGAWTTAARTIPEDVQEVVTGLSGTVAEVRVATVNGARTTGYTNPITALGV